MTLYALKTGYRHVDSAHMYGNEAECAEALLESGIPRSELFFTTKIPPQAMSSEGAKESIEKSLEKCKGLGYLDLVLLHAPCKPDVPSYPNRLHPPLWQSLTNP